MKKILLIEDDINIRETTEEILELSNFQVFTAEDGKSGIKLAKEKKPDLIICDIMMPNLDGYSVLQILSKNPDTFDIPFIFLTAKSEKKDIRRGMNLGADDYITKPFEESELLEAVEVRIQKNDRFKNEIKNFDEFLFEASGLQDLELLPENRRVKKYNKKEVIYREDDFANFLYYVEIGKVKCLKTDEFGKDFISEIYGPQDFIGYVAMFEDGDYNETAIAMEDTEVALIPKADFTTLIHKNRDVAAKFIKLLSGNIKEREGRLLQLAYAPVRERVANALLKIKNKVGQSDSASNDFTISREDIANIVGTAKESLNRTISEFKKEGLLDTDGQKITLLNEVELKKIAANN